MYYVIAMALFRHVNLREVLRCLLEGFRRLHGDLPVKITGKSGISQARSRLGSEPLQRLYESVVQPIATQATLGAWYRGWRLVSLDGSTLDLPDEAPVRAHFGGPSTYNDRSPFPQARFVTLAEVGTHVLFGAEVASYSKSEVPVCRSEALKIRHDGPDLRRDAAAGGEVTLARTVIEHLDDGMLCLADRGYFGFDLWQQAARTGAALLWRAPSSIKLPVETALADGSYLSHLNTWRRRNLTPKRQGMLVRVVEYRIDGVGKDGEVCRLVTTILGHEQAEASDLAKLYHQRWEIETAFDEVKTHLRGARLCLRSKTADLVRQEFFGMMLAHFAVRGLMHEAALQADEDPDRLSFTHSLNVVRRKASLAATLSPSISA